MNKVRTTTAGAAAALLLLTGCGGKEEGPGEVRVQTGPQDVQVRAVQGCDNGDPVRYDTKPPVIEVSPDADITLTVPDSVAERGWAVQVFDEKLEKAINEPLEVPDGEKEVTVSSDTEMRPAFYLLVVENKGGDCGAWSRAWPVGFIRPGGDISGATETPTPSAAP